MQKNILITGGTGFIGTALCKQLSEIGYKIYVLSRSHHQSCDEINYIKALPEVDGIPMCGIINLAGESLAKGRWNTARKAEFIRSRVETTHSLITWLSKQEHKPSSIISGSAIGYYGASGDRELNEQSPSNDCFSHQLCAQWEDSARDLKQFTERLCLVRIGVVLGHSGGPFTEMRKSFDKKIAAQMGSGEQWLSWIHLQDMVNSLVFLLEHKSAQGIYNATAPGSVQNKVFTRILAGKMNSWIRLSLPGWLLMLIVGEMAEEILLTGQRVVPQRLIEEGFEFEYADLNSALSEILSHSS